MSCNEDRVIAFLAGELSDDDERRFDEHLLQCEECWRAVQADRAARFALEKLPRTGAGWAARPGGAWPSPSPPRTRPGRGAALAGSLPCRFEGRLSDRWCGSLAAASLLIALAAGTFAWARSQGPDRQNPPRWPLSPP